MKVREVLEKAPAVFFYSTTTRLLEEEEEGGSFHLMPGVMSKFNSFRRFKRYQRHPFDITLLTSYHVFWVLLSLVWMIRRVEWEAIKKSCRTWCVVAVTMVIMIFRLCIFDSYIIRSIMLFLQKICSNSRGSFFFHSRAFLNVATH